MGDVAAFFEQVRAGDAGAVSESLQRDRSLVNAKNEKGVSAILMACYAGRKEVRDLLLREGAQLEAHEAVAAGQIKKVTELVERDTSVAKGFSPDGFPLVALAAAFGHEEVARYLHGKGADINVVSTNGSGYTALTGAVASGHTAIAQWLIDSGADVNYRYAKGYSPLLTAAANGHQEIVKALLAKGADLNARSDDGKSALQLAEERGHGGVAAYLRDVGLTG
jgi:uncharacterized protein